MRLDEPARVHPERRLAILMAGVEDKKRVVDTLRALKFSNQEAAVAGSYVEALHDLRSADTPYAIRRVLARLGRELAPGLVELAAIDAPAAAVEVQRILDDRDPLVLKELAITGTDLLAAGHPAGRGLGELLGELLDRVHHDPALNTRDALLGVAAVRR